MRALKFTHRAVAAIEAARIPVVVLKGAVAASRWADPTVRQQSDVDLLVRVADKDAATRALLDARVCGERFLDSEHMHNDSLSPADPSGLVVELHHALSSHHDIRVRTEELLERRTRVKTAQGELPALSVEDDAVYLALHATTHALARLAWLVDLAVLQPEWMTAASRARSWGVGPAVAPAWRRARELLGAPVPQRALEALGVSSLQLAIGRTVLAATEASQHRLNRFAQQLFRLSIVPPRALPFVVARKLRAGREEHDAYARKYSS